MSTLENPVKNEMASPTAPPLLEINDLKVVFQTYAGQVKALDGINLTLYKGETVGLVGESGCGKSVTATTIVGLLSENAKVAEGQILLNKDDLLRMNRKEMREIRAKKVAMVFQDPATFLNPVLTIGQQIGEVFQLDSARIERTALGVRMDELKSKVKGATNPNEREQAQAQLDELTKSSGSPPKADRRTKKIAVNALVKDALLKARLPDPDRIMREYPHELSGGMKQRCMIAMAIARNPELLIADEITTALDVTIQAQILELLRLLKEEVQSTILIITHDLGIVAETCDRVAVMYAGNVIEVTSVKELFRKPLHPYTQGLLKAIPKFAAGRERLESIPGSVPDLIYPPTGCRFHPRCSYAWDLCQKVKPELYEAEKGHTVACHLYTKEGKK